MFYIACITYVFYFLISVSFKTFCVLDYTATLFFSFLGAKHLLYHISYIISYHIIVRMVAEMN